MLDSKWKKLSAEEKIAHLISTCNAHIYFGKSKRPWDEEDFKTLQLDYPVDAIRAALNEMDKYYRIRRDKAAHKKDWQRTLMNWLKKKKKIELTSQFIRNHAETVKKSRKIRCRCGHLFDPEFWASPNDRKKCYDCYLRGK